MMFALSQLVFGDLKSALLPSLLFVAAIAIGLLAGYIYIVYLALIAISHLKDRTSRRVFYTLLILLALILPVSIYAN